MDVRKDPAWVDIGSGPKGTPMEGIFKRDGDTLTLCLAMDAGGNRPTAFESKAGEKVVLLTLTRAKKKD